MASFVRVQVEHEIERIAVRAQKELILLHRMGSLKPKGTARWLKERNWCTFHHHVRCPERVFRDVNLQCYVGNWMTVEEQQHRRLSIV